MKQSNIKIAITGGIGSGKTTVCKILQEKGYPVFSCDEVYSELLRGDELTKEISKEFGGSVLNSDNTLNREVVSEIVFNDKQKLEKLNKITHTKIFEEIFRRADDIEGLVFFEVPLLFEGNYQNLFNDVIVVLREEEQRINSVILRDKLSADDVINRINKQLKYDFCNFAQYYVIHNNGKISDLYAKIDDILLNITK